MIDASDRLSMPDPKWVHHARAAWRGCKEPSPCSPRLHPSWDTATLLGLMSYVAYAEFLKIQRRAFGAGIARLLALRQAICFHPLPALAQVQYGA